MLIPRLHFAQWERLRHEERSRDDDGGSNRQAEGESEGEGGTDPLDDPHVEIHVSEVDRDPYGFMISKAEL